MPQWAHGVVLVVAGVAFVIARRALAPFTQGSIGATGDTRLKVERSWAMIGVIFVLLGVFILIKNT